MITVHPLVFDVIFVYTELAFSHIKEKATKQVLFGKFISIESLNFFNLTTQALCESWL